MLSTPVSASSTSRIVGSGRAVALVCWGASDETLVSGCGPAASEVLGRQLTDAPNKHRIASAARTAESGRIVTVAVP